MRVALLQMTAGVDPQANATTLVDAVHQAAAQGANMLFTPEMSGCLDRDKARSAGHITTEAKDPVLHAVRQAAREAGIWVQLGSLAIVDEDGESKRRNRAFLINAAGDIRAHYDKIHLFDVDLPSGESWRESSSYGAGTQPVLAQTPWGKLGLSICYDLRFPDLYRTLSNAGAELIAVPAAFTVPTGEAHWEVLLRARAIESAAFVIAAAQVGQHEDGRRTYGHSLVIDPWGVVLLDAGVQSGLFTLDLPLARLADIRTRLPALRHRRPIGEPLVS